VSFRTGLDVLEGRDIYCRCWETRPESPNAQSSHCIDYDNSAVGELMNDKLKRNCQEAVVPSEVSIFDISCKNNDKPREV